MLFFEIMEVDYMFIKENLNPKGWKCGDCVIRACAKATQKSWDDAYNDLYAIAFKKKRMLNDDCVYNKFLLDNGFEYCKQMKDAYGNKFRVMDLISHYNKIDLEHNTKTTLVIHTRKHLTCVVSGDIYDTWNTNYEVAGYYYVKSEENEGSQ